MAQIKRFAMRQRLVNLVLVVAATVDLPTNFLPSLFDIHVVRDIRVGRYRVVQRQFLDNRSKIRSLGDALRLFILSKCCRCCRVDDVHMDIVDATAEAIVPDIV